MAKALESLGISLEVVRQQVGEIIGQGQQGHIPFTPRAKKVLELSLWEAQQLGHTYIGTEHILLGLIREGEGVAARVLVKLVADLNRAGEQVIQLLHGYQGKEPQTALGGLRRGRVAPDIPARMNAIEARLSAIEQRVGNGDDPAPATSTSRSHRCGGTRSQPSTPRTSSRRGSLRDRERQLLAGKTARQHQWEAPIRTWRPWPSRCSASAAR